MFKKRRFALAFFFTVAIVGVYRLFYKTDPINLALVIGGSGVIFGVLFDVIIEKIKNKKNNEKV